jgi:hypothetical protein
LDDKRSPEKALKDGDKEEKSTCGVTLFYASE